MNTALFPLRGQSNVPTLRVIGGRLTIGTEGSDRTREIPIGTGGAATLARYSTTIRNPRGSDRHRVGWQVLDRDGQVLVWLGNAEEAMYDTAQAAEFATSAGLRPVDLGEVSWSRLQQIPADARIGGPGTTAVTSVVAPALQWVLCLVVIGGALAAEGPFVRSDFSSSGSGAGVLLGIFRFLVGIFGGIVVAKFLGQWLFCYLEKRRCRRRSAVLRSADRLPALSVTTGYGELVVRDLEGLHQVPAREGIALQRYQVPPGSRGKHLASRGLLVRDPRKVALDVPAEFDASEVSAFAARISANVWRPETDPRQLPKQPKGKERPVRAGRRWWQRAGLVVLVLLFLSPVFAAVAVAHVAGLVPLPAWLAWELGGISLLTVGGWLLVRAQVPAWVVHPDTVPEPTPEASGPCHDPRTLDPR